MDVYIYEAALLCEECGEKIRRELDRTGQAPEDPADEKSYDSDDYPKGPYPDGGGESDSPQHCDECGAFLENELTDEGREYVGEMIAEHFKAGRGRKEVLKEWADFYDIPFEAHSHRREEVGENPRRGPGKFDSDLDAILYSLALDGTDEDFSEEGFGSYSLLVNITREDLERAAKDAGETLTEEDVEEGEGASAILFERTDGIVEVDLYDSEEEARKDWAKVEKAYEEFMEEVEEGG
jgi:hypothetical protein